MINPEMGHRLESSNNLSDEKKLLKKELQKKSFSEKHISEFQTRKAPIRGAENSEISRGEVFRFERGQIFKAYKILREQIKVAREKGEDVAKKKNLLKEIRRQAKVLEKNLDELNRQYYENVRNVEIKTEFGNFSVPVVELDLRRKKEEEEGSEEAEKDERTPYFLLGSVATNYHQTAALSMGLALEGQRVLVPAWPEQEMVGKPDNFGELLKKQKNLRLHKEFAKQTVRSMGLDRVNIMGYSMGGAVALELAQDQDFQEMQDLVVIEPAGLEKKGLTGIGKDFVLKEGLLKTFPYSEARIKTLSQGSKENKSSLGFLMEDGRILSKKHFDSEKLAKINPKGRYQLWVGTKSSITDYRTAEEVFLEAEKIRQQGDSNVNPVEIHVVNGGTHGWPCMNSLGFSRLLNEKESEEQVSVVKLSELENSGMEKILKGSE